MVVCAGARIRCGALSRFPSRRTKRITYVIGGTVTMPSIQRSLRRKPMPREDTRFTRNSMWLARCLVLLLAASICPGYLSAKVTVGASKDCSTSPCTLTYFPPNVTPPPPMFGFKTVVTQTITWAATYTGGGSGGQSFYITTNPCACIAETALTTSGQLGGSLSLSPGTYY